MSIDSELSLVTNGTAHHEALSESTQNPPIPTLLPHEHLASQNMYLPFSYQDYTDGANNSVTLHYCRNLAELNKAIPHLKGAKHIGIDLEYKPPGRDEIQESAASIQLREEANPIASELVARLTAENPGKTVEEKTKFGYISGVKIEGQYLRFTRYAKSRLSVLQLASASHIIVAHFAAFPTTEEIADGTEFITESLKEIMADESILKLGVSVFGVGSDTYHLSRYFDLPSAGLLELNDLYFSMHPCKQQITEQDLLQAQSDPSSPGSSTDSLLEQPVAPKPKPPKRPTIGLKDLAKMYLNRTLIGKGTGNTTTSEWHLPQPLSAEQLEYAANDAFVSVKIYEAMMRERTAMTVVPKFPETHEQEFYDHEKSQQEQIARWKASGSKSANRNLKKLGNGWQAPPEKLNVPEGGSKSQVQSENRRARMDPRDAALAEMLTQQRNEIMEERRLGPTEKFKVLSDDMIDRLACRRPRPRSAEEVLAALSPSKRKHFCHAQAFFELIWEQSELEAGMGGAVQAIGAVVEPEGKGEPV